MVPESDHFKDNACFYCSTLLKAIDQLQLIQNGSAHVLTKTRQTAYIIFILKSLHFLLVCHVIHACHITSHILKIPCTQKYPKLIKHMVQNMVQIPCRALMQADYIG